MGSMGRGRPKGSKDKVARKRRSKAECKGEVVPANIPVDAANVTETPIKE